MNKFYLLTFMILNSIFNSASSQTTIIYNSGGLPILFSSQENSAETAQKYKNAEINLSKAYDAYEEGNLEKTKYFLEQSEKKGIVSPGFYFLLGQYFFVKKQYHYAKRYWNRGFKRGCWECKDKIATIPNQ